jgi:ribonuclease HI
MSQSGLGFSRVYTDGSCMPNPGAGGWGFFVEGTDNRPSDHSHGRNKMTTNNRMELTAVIRAMEAISGPIEILTDSSYVMLGITSWIVSWKKNGWRNAAKQPVLNKDLWVKLDALVSSRPAGTVRWTKVNAHSNLEGNDCADALARGDCCLRPVCYCVTED